MPAFALPRCPNHNALPLNATRSKPPKIPGMCHGGAPKSRFTADDVATALVLRALDIPRAVVARALGANPLTVRQWGLGMTRGALIRSLG